MVVRWNEVADNDQGIPSMIPGSKTATECQTDFFPTVIVIHHITNEMSRVQKNDIEKPPQSIIVKNEKSTLNQIDVLPFIDEEELEMSEGKKKSKRIVKG
jgi:CTP synthase (UTP-ammonia lyase)